MKIILQVLQIVFVLFAIYCMWHGVAMVPGIGALLLAIWAELWTQRIEVREQAQMLALVIGSERANLHSRIDANETTITTLDATIGSYGCDRSSL